MEEIQPPNWTERPKRRSWQSSAPVKLKPKPCGVANSGPASCIFVHKRALGNHQSTRGYYLTPVLITVQVQRRSAEAKRLPDFESKLPLSDTTPLAVWGWRKLRVMAQGRCRMKRRRGGRRNTITTNEHAQNTSPMQDGPALNPRHTAPPHQSTRELEYVYTALQTLQI